MNKEKNHPSQSRGKSDYIPDWKVDLAIEDKLVNRKRLKKWKYQDMV
jgi:hypothetical protein